jgi:hypothetical protein
MFHMLSQIRPPRPVRLLGQAAIPWTGYKWRPVGVKIPATHL